MILCQATVILLISKTFWYELSCWKQLKYSQVTSTYLFPRDISFPHSLYFCVWVEPGDPWTNRIQLSTSKLDFSFANWNMKPMPFYASLFYYLYIFSFHFLCRCVCEFVYLLKTIIFSGILKHHVLYHGDLQICA